MQPKFSHRFLSTAVRLSNYRAGVSFAGSRQMCSRDSRRVEVVGIENSSRETGKRTSGTGIVVVAGRLTSLSSTRLTKMQRLVAQILITMRTLGTAGAGFSS